MPNWDWGLLTAGRNADAGLTFVRHSGINIWFLTSYSKIFQLFNYTFSILKFISWLCPFKVQKVPTAKVGTVYREEGTEGVWGKNPVIYFQMGIHSDIAMLFYISSTQYPMQDARDTISWKKSLHVCIQEKLWIPHKTSPVHSQRVRIRVGHSHRSQGWSEECALSTCIGGNVSTLHSTDLLGHYSSWDLWARDGWFWSKTWAQILSPLMGI